MGIALTLILAADAGSGATSYPWTCAYDVDGHLPNADTCAWTSGLFQPYSTGFEPSGSPASGDWLNITVGQSGFVDYTRNVAFDMGDGWHLAMRLAVTDTDFADEQNPEMFRWFGEMWARNTDTTETWGMFLFANATDWKVRLTNHSEYAWADSPAYPYGYGFHVFEYVSAGTWINATMSFKVDGEVIATFGDTWAEAPNTVVVALVEAIYTNPLSETSVVFDWWAYEITASAPPAVVASMVTDVLFYGFIFACGFLAIFLIAGRRRRTGA